MKKNIIIYGAGGFGREVAWLIERINEVNHEWNVLGFVDDVKTEMYGKPINGLTVLGGREWFNINKDEVYITCAMGKSQSRRKIYSSLEILSNVKLATLVDPSVMLSGTSSIGEGSIVCCGSRVMTNAKIGKGVVVNTGSSVGHDVKLDDYCTLLTNVMVSGTVRIGENTEIGSGAFVLEYRTVGSDIVIAPLTSVLTDIAVGGTYAGNPARRIR
jgi:sugar O-acyltransferase (sialic acid O-acetyltransferase NeuD family)